MDKASVYGTGDCRFESYQDQFFGLEHDVSRSLLVFFWNLAAIVQRKPQWLFGLVV